MIIRTVKEKDLITMLEIERENYSQPWDFKILYYEVIKNEKSVFFGAYINNVLVGYLGFWAFDDNVDIINIAISKNHQRMGIATRLFDSLFDYAHKIKATTITLEVNVNNHAAYNLYYKLGFTTLRTIKNYYDKIGEDAYLMQKEVLYEWYNYTSNWK